MKKWQIENSEKSEISEISEKLLRFFLFPSFRFCPTAKIEGFTNLGKTIPRFPRFPRFPSFGPGRFGNRNYIKKKYVEATWIFQPAKLH